MEITTQDNIKLVSLMGTESMFGKMEINMKGTLSMTQEKAKEY